MIFIKNHKQHSLFNEWDKLGPKRSRLLKESWAGLFREHLLSELPVDALTPFFSKGLVRPTKELYTVIGVLIFQQMHDLTDEETMMRLAFDMQWHYALNIPEESDILKYISEKTLWNMRKTVTDNGLEDVIFTQPTKKLQKMFAVIIKKQRIDSVHIKSNMRNLGGVGILSKAINKFLINLRRHNKQRFNGLPEEIKSRYFSKKAMQCFGMVKPSETRKMLKTVADELFDLVSLFKGDKVAENMNSYKLLCRILKEHCNIKESEDGSGIELKPAKEISSDSVQNPSDPDAGYSGHKGQGYSAQIMETYCTSEDKEEKQQTLNLITYVEVESADNSDAKALMPAIEKSEENNFKPKEMLADPLYGSDENCEKAKTKKVEIISPVMGKNKKEGYHISEFEFFKKSRISKCPKGNKPLFNKKNMKGYSSGFEIKICEACSMVDKCCTQKGKNYYYLRYTKKSIRTAMRRKKEKSFEFKDKYRFRAGVEATMSELDRKTGIKHLRVRGLKAVRYCVFLKALAVNIFRATAVRKVKNRLNRAAESLASAVFIFIFNFKELFNQLLSKSKFVSIKIAMYA